MNESNEDPRLRRLLREWPDHQPLPPRFREGVWQRIDTAERGAARPAFSWSERLASLFARPLTATACVAVLLLAGVSTGLLWGGHDDARWEAHLSQHYVASINPYAVDKP